MDGSLWYKVISYDHYIWSDGIEDGWMELSGAVIRCCCVVM